MQLSIDALSSFDRINLASTFLQAAVAVAFAAAINGAARHFGRPAMLSLALVWRLVALATVINIFSAWSGAVWQNRELSRILTGSYVAALAATIPLTALLLRQLGEQEVRFATPRALMWRIAIGVFVAHTVLIFGSASLFPDLRVVTVTTSRLIQVVVLSAPLWLIYQSTAGAAGRSGTQRLLLLGFAAPVVRQTLSVLLGLRVGMPDLPFGAVTAVIVFDVLCVMSFGVFSLLAITSDELDFVNGQRHALLHAEAKLAASLRMESLGRMAAGVAHDFNNGLQVVRLTLDSLTSSPMPSEDRSMVNEADRAVTHCMQLVSQLLTFARQKPQQPVPFDPMDRLRSLTALLQRVAGNRAQCDVLVEEGSATIVMDPVQFEQIAINLVTNARDAVGESGRITVRLDRIRLIPGDDFPAEIAPGAYVRLSVEDTGHGIPEEIRGRIFDPFFTTKKPGEGSGLGLSTVHGIARQLAGDVTLSTEPGKGTRFEVFLPAA